MVRIRLRRVGRKKQPSYRIVVADSRSPRDGRYIEIIGFYNPRTQPSTMTIKEERALHWLSVGAQPSEAVERILVKLGTRGRYERLSKGEELEALLAEAQAEDEAREPVSPKTSYPAMSKEAKAQLKEQRARAAEKAEAEADAAPVAEAAADTEAEAVAEAEVETEAEVEAEAEAPAEESSEEAEA